MAQPITSIVAAVWNDTSTNWANSNTVIDRGVLCHETDTGKVKIGNDVDLYSDLDYVVDSVFTEAFKNLLDDANTANGVLVLNSSGKVDTTYLPAALLNPIIQHKADYAALSSISAEDRVKYLFFVADASDDPSGTVTSGWAIYIRNDADNGWVKIQEGEGLDIPAVVLEADNVTYSPPTGFSSYTDVQLALDYLFPNTVKITYNNYTTIPTSVAGDDVILVSDKTNSYNLYKVTVDSFFTSRTFIAPQLNGPTYKSEGPLGFTSGICALGGITSGVYKLVNVNGSGSIILPISAMTTSYFVEYTIIATQDSTGGHTYDIITDTTANPGSEVRWPGYGAPGYTPPYEDQISTAPDSVAVYKLYRQAGSSIWYGRLVATYP